MILDIHVDDPLGAGNRQNIDLTMAELRHYVLIKEGKVLTEGVTLKHLARSYTREDKKVRVTLGKKCSDDTGEMARMKGCKAVRTPGTNSKSKEEEAADKVLEGVTTLGEAHRLEKGGH